MKRFLEDLKVVLRPLWLIIVMQLVVMLTFWCIPQGPDVLFAVIENYSGLLRPEVNSVDIHWLPLVGFILSLVYWSLASECCSRLLLHTADLTSTEIPLCRTWRRTKLALVVPSVLYAFPGVVVVVGLIRAYLSRTSVFDVPNLVMLLLLLGLLSLVGVLLYHIRYGFFARLFFTHRATPTQIRQVVEQSGFWYHGYFKRMLWFTGVLILLMAVVPATTFRLLGPTAFICLGFGAWTVVYTGIQLLHKLKGWPQLPYKTIILLLVVCSAYLNDDHPVRLLRFDPVKDERLQMQQHFRDRMQDQHPAAQVCDTVPVVFIAAEGGALRTGCFTAMMLAKLQDSFPQFRRRIYGMSSVSGGSLGMGVFNALQLADVPPQRQAVFVRKFFAYDFLAPVAAKLMLAEPLNWLSVSHLPLCDRMLALEDAWLQSWQLAEWYTFSKSPVFNQGWQQWVRARPPVWCINTMEAESGMRGLISNAQVPEGEWYNSWDVLPSVYPADMPYVTAIGLSARFPFISPGGSITDSSGVRRHYVDGGYYENKGAVTLLDMLQSCREATGDLVVIRPFVLQLSFDSDSIEDTPAIQHCNEWMEVLQGFMQIRQGHTRYASAALQAWVKAAGGVYIEWKVGASKHMVPMNWALSGYALSQVEARCDYLLRRDTTQQAALQAFYAILQPQPDDTSGLY